MWKISRMKTYLFSSLLPFHQEAAWPSSTEATNVCVLSMLPTYPACSFALPLQRSQLQKTGLSVEVWMFQKLWKIIWHLGICIPLGIRIEISLLNWYYYRLSHAGLPGWDAHRYPQHPLVDYISERLTQLVHTCPLSQTYKLYPAKSISTLLNSLPQF